MIVEQLAQAYRNACMAELEALKPGNIHVFADGHGMTIQDFIKSADASAMVIAQPNLSVGERILKSVQATHAAVGINTNLGIILLCAPLIQAAIDQVLNPEISFLKKLATTLNNLTVEDANLVAQAIVLANPAGLGATEDNDVHTNATVSLLEMMASAQDKDRIAWQYANYYSDIFEFGMPEYVKALARWQDSSNSRGQNKAWATTAIYLGFLARQLDSHIVRKFGEEVAKQVMQEAKGIEKKFKEAGNPKLLQKQLLAMDTALKKRGINPGTTADLTVACLLLSDFDVYV